MPENDFPVYFRNFETRIRGQNCKFLTVWPPGECLTNNNFELKGRSGLCANSVKGNSILDTTLRANFDINSIRLRADVWLFIFN